MNPRAFDVVMFDMGGVLVELGGMSVMMEWTAGKWTEAQLWRKWLLCEAGRAFESGRIGPAAFAVAMIEEFELPVSPETYLHTFRNWILAPYPGALELLDGLAGTYTRACLSNTNELHWERMAESMGLGVRFEHVFPSHLTGRVKPDRDAFVVALERMSAIPARVLYFDDSPVNVEAARALGIAAYRVAGVVGVRRILDGLKEES